MRPATLKDARTLGAGKPHGTRMRYMAGCRCVPCRAANSRYETERAADRRRGEWNGRVPACRARAHILKLSRRGMGYKTLASLAGISKSVCFKIRSGERSAIRANTERRILAIQANGNTLAAHAFVKADHVQHMIGRLLKEGFTRADIAQRALGNKMPALQLNQDVVLVETERKIRAFYRSVLY